MKKLSLFLAIVLLMGLVPGTAYADAAVVQKFTSSQTKTQGLENFRYVQFNGNTVTDLVWSTDNSRWEATPNGRVYTYIVPGTDTDVGMLFTAPMKGVVRLRGEVTWPSAKGTCQGVIISIGKGQETLFEKKAEWGENVPYDLEVNVRKGDKLFFRVDSNGRNDYDTLLWWPSVEYLAKQYDGAAGRDGYEYLEKSNGEVRPLVYNEEEDKFCASDGIAYFNDYEIMPTKECSLINRYTVTESGKYRVKANIKATNRRSSGKVVRIYKNDELMWQQLIPEKEGGKVDVRFMAQKDDKIDFEVSTGDYDGFNYSEFSLDISKLGGTAPFADLSTTSGMTYGIEDEFTLSSKIGTSDSAAAKCFAYYNSTKYPMTYNSSQSAWIGTVLGDATSKVTKTSVSPANTAGEVRIDLGIEKSGTLKIEGNLPVDEGTRGLLIKLYKNEKEIWSNRIGGDSFARWDDEVDTKYFVNDINVVCDVAVGDTLTFEFSRWMKRTNGSAVNIEDITLKYITGEVLSKTTKWKIAQSVILDTETKTAYVDGKTMPVDLVVINGASYIEKSAAEIIGVFGDAPNKTINGKTYIPIRAAAEGMGKSVMWGADRLIAIHDGIPLMFGTPEFSEMKAALKGGNLID